MSKSIKIILADFHEVYLEKLSILIEHQDGFEVLAIANDAEELLVAAKDKIPDVVLVDAKLILDNENDLLEQIRNINNSIKIISLSLHADPETVHDLIQKGSTGFLLKKSDFKEFVLGINQVHRGKVFLDKESSDLLF